jgi:hypothetical protein
MRALQSSTTEYGCNVFRAADSSPVYPGACSDFQGVSLVTFFAPAKKVTRWREATAEALLFKGQ